MVLASVLTQSGADATGDGAAVDGDPDPFVGSPSDGRPRRARPLSCG